MCMKRNSSVYETCAAILRRELIPAMGCTEPIAIAYCAAAARELLEALPDRIDIAASGNIIKNVKSVRIPHTAGLRGIEASAALGAYAGDASARLEVISHISPERLAGFGEYFSKTTITIYPVDSDEALDVIANVYAGDSSARVRIAREHTNIVYKEKNGVPVYQKELGAEPAPDEPDYGLLSVSAIIDFADTCELDDVRDVLNRQIRYNTAIADEGLQKDYGANVGKTLLASYGNDVRTRARARAAAGSDARMNGCELPVIINSGSGNQGMTASLPVIEYAQTYQVGQEKLYRALLVSNLITIHEKSYIGRLSAYCGAVSAGAGAGAGIAYLLGGDSDTIAHTIVNALAVTSGIVCDGAKASCAAKISAAVDAGIFGYEMYRNGQQFYGGEGLVVKGVENSIRSFGRLGRIAMRETDREIIRMMTER